MRRVQKEGEGCGNPGRAPHGARCPRPHQPQQRASCDHTCTERTAEASGHPTRTASRPPQTRNISPSAPSEDVDRETTFSCILINRTLQLVRTARQFRVGGTLLSITPTKCPWGTRVGRTCCPDHTEPDLPGDAGCFLDAWGRPLVGGEQGEPSARVQGAEGGTGAHHGPGSRAAHWEHRAGFGMCSCPRATELAYRCWLQMKILRAPKCLLHGYSQQKAGSYLSL